MEPLTDVTGPQPLREASPVRTVAWVSLGCPKNLIDSEKMLGMLAQAGLIPTSDHDDADAIVINTCGFLEASKDEAVQEISRAAMLKRSGQCRRLVVAGCLVQRQRAKLLDLCPDIDAMIGVFDRDRIVEAVTGGCQGSPAGDDFPHAHPVYSSIASSAVIAKRRRGIQGRGYFEDDAERLRLTPRHYAYLRIGEGCNQHCSFCTIPSIRGKMRSKPIDRIQNELRELIRDGAFEINLIGQDTTSYGRDLGDGPGLDRLLQAIDQTVAQEAGTAGGWLRLMYAYPSSLTDEMIDAMARLSHVVKYIDMPLQHISDPVLSRMRRHTTRRQIESLLDKLRTRVEGIAIRTTLITGFPGESEAQHRELVRFVRDARFEAMGVFAYSPEPGTAAGTMHTGGHAVHEAVVQRRYEELMLTQQETVLAYNQRLARRGDRFDVLIDVAVDADGAGHQPAGLFSDGTACYAGRTYFQAPQIDGCTYVVQTTDRLVPGQLVRCQVTGVEGYDLVAKPVSCGAGRFSLPVVS